MIIYDHLASVLGTKPLTTSELKQLHEEHEQISMSVRNERRSDHASAWASAHITELWERGVYANRAPPSEEHKAKISKSMIGRVQGDNQKRLASEANSEWWDITSPTGETITVSNLLGWCRDNGQHASNLTRRSPVSKLWKAKKREPEGSL